MTRKKLAYRTAAWLAVCFFSIMLPLSASDDKPDTAASDIEQLKQMLLKQQQEIDNLQRKLDQKESVASQTPAEVPAAPTLTPALHPAPENTETNPLQLKIGDAYITPLGFMDMIAVSRSENTGNATGTNFGSIPYGNTQTGSLTETRFSIQNSRLGARFDAMAKGYRILGYWESDFLGQLGNPPNGGVAVSSNSYVLRMRLYFVDVNKGKFEFLAGQSWSLMTPNRYGISPLTGDVFYSQNIDTNYQAGAVWARNAGFRFGYHPNGKVAIGIALENSEPYVGGANGSSVIVPPAALSSLLGTQVNNGSSVLSAPAVAPDIVAKIAFDPSRRLHFEVAGVEIMDKIANPASTPVDQTFSKVGGGGSLNINYALFNKFRLISNNYYSAGGGRYIFGQAPDFIIRPNGSLSLVHSGSTASGFEWTVGKQMFYSYYGGIYIDKDTAIDANGKSLIGYGAISSDGQNRAIQEFTVGSNTTLMKDPKWGALNLMFQYSYLERNPWLAVAGAPTNAHVSMGFVDFRYTLPGLAPSIEH